MNRILTVVAMLAFLAPGASAATDNSVFGVAKIGEKFTLKQCGQLADGKYVGVDSETCYKNELILSAQNDPTMWTVVKDSIATTATSPLRTAMLDISFSLPPALIAKGGVLRIQVIDGVAEYASFDTNGVLDQEAILSALKTKYGEPAVMNRESIQNAAGATFTSVTARWNFEKFIVFFPGNKRSHRPRQCHRSYAKRNRLRSKDCTKYERTKNVVGGSGVQRVTYHNAMCARTNRNRESLALLLHFLATRH